MSDPTTPHAPPDKVEALVRLIPSMSPGLVDSLLMAHRLVVSRYEGQGPIIVRIQDVLDAAHGHKPRTVASADTSPQTFTGHIRCHKCGGTHWINGPCKPNAQAVRTGGPTT